MKEEKGGIIYTDEKNACVDNTPKPLTNDELYHMVGEPVFVTAPHLPEKWRVIESIKINPDGVMIQFSDNCIDHLEDIRCYRERTVFHEADEDEAIRIIRRLRQL